jgi:vanillate O-demethylase ferredoxin subunit
MAPLAISEARDETASIAVRLQRSVPIAKDALLLEFASLNRPLPQAAPGAHIDVHVPGMGLRQYSLVTPLCSAASYVIAVKREAAGRGGSIWLHDKMRVGTELLIGRPRNNFELDETAEETLLLAAGIGITPIYAMFERLQQLGRPVRLHYWSRSAEHALFRERLEGHPDATLIHSSGGRAVSAGDVLRAAPARAEIYCCGPSRMLDECIASAPRSQHLHVEHFASVAKDQCGSEPQDGVGGFIVHLARKKLDIEVAPGETILNTLIAAGIDVAYSCEEGVCGACETKVLEGTPLHRDAVRRPEEHQRRSTFMICCSLSRESRLVLDI